MRREDPSPRRTVIAAAVLIATLSGCGGATDPAEQPAAATPSEGAAPWPVPSDPLERAVAAGLHPATREFLDFHVHAHLDVFVNGEPVEVPAAIGINIEDPGVRALDTPTGTGYGGIEECDQPCISPLHTHDTSGVIHTESAESQANVLGQFFLEWDVALEEDCVGGYCEPDATIQVFVDGEIYEGNPADIELTDGKQISVVIGSPPAEVPSAYDFSNA